MSNEKAKHPPPAISSAEGYPTRRPVRPVMRSVTCAVS